MQACTNKHAHTHNFKEKEKKRKSKHGSLVPVLPETIETTERSLGVASRNTPETQLIPHPPTSATGNFFWAGTVNEHEKRRHIRKKQPSCSCLDPYGRRQAEFPIGESIQRTC